MLVEIADDIRLLVAFFGIFALCYCLPILFAHQPLFLLFFFILTNSSFKFDSPSLQPQHYIFFFKFLCSFPLSSFKKLLFFLALKKKNSSCLFLMMSKQICDRTIFFKRFYSWCIHFYSKYFRVTSFDPSVYRE